MWSSTKLKSLEHVPPVLVLKCFLPTCKRDAFQQNHAPYAPIKSQVPEYVDTLQCLLSQDIYPAGKSALRMPSFALHLQPIQRNHSTSSKCSPA